MLLLRFFSFIYGLFTELKNILFNYNILKSKNFNKTLICVGNLSTGGTGKTSFVDHLINMLSKDYKIGIISRGYKRKSKGFHFVNDIDTNKYGDEVCMLKSKYPFLIIAVDINRQRGINKLIDKNVELIIMDDGFQNRWVKADIQFILTTFKNPFFNDYLLPFGRLREKKKNFKRSDYIINLVGVLAENSKITDINKLQRKMFTACIEYLEKIILLAEPKKGVYIAIDGVAPVAKIKQQRSRRLRHLLIL